MPSIAHAVLPEYIDYLSSDRLEFRLGRLDRLVFLYLAGGCCDHFRVLRLYAHVRPCQ